MGGSKGSRGEGERRGKMRGEGVVGCRVNRSENRRKGWK